MNRQTLKTLTALACTVIGLGLASTSRAEHFTAYLDNLSAEVNTRLGDTTGLSAKQVGALKASSHILSRDTKTTQADLGQLNVVSAILNKAFPDDATLGGLETDALNSFIADAQTRRAGLDEDVSLIEHVPAGITKQLAQIDTALSNATSAATFKDQAKSANLALIRIKAAGQAIGHLIKAPLVLEGFAVTLKERAARHPATIFLTTDGAATDDTGTGTWDYHRVSANTGVITTTITPTAGGDPVTRTFDLTFKSPKGGTFTEEGGAALTGTFTVSR